MPVEPIKHRLRSVVRVVSHSTRANFRETCRRFAGNRQTTQPQPVTCYLLSDAPVSHAPADMPVEQNKHRLQSVVRVVYHLSPAVISGTCVLHFPGKSVAYKTWADCSRGGGMMEEER